MTTAGPGTTTARPLLSIIVPSYNQGRFIGDCLKEPIAHRAAGVEVIVMDGGSGDETVAHLQELSGEIDFWVSEKDEGQAHAINKGFAKARGEWVAFQNSDDFYLDGKLGLVLATMKAHPQADLIIGGAAFVDEAGRPFRKALPKPIFRLALAHRNLINNQALFIRRSFLERVGFLDPAMHFCLDYEWFLRIFQERPAVVYLHDHIGAQRYHAATKTSNLKHVYRKEFGEIRARFFSPVERFIGTATFPAYQAFRKAYEHTVRLLGIRTLKLPLR